MNAEAKDVESRLADVTDRMLGKRDPLDWMEEFTLTTKEAEKISDPSWIEEGLIAAGHVVAIVAKPNGGKTTILFDLACRWSADYTCVFVDSDTNPADAKRKLAMAREAGMHYLTPDLKVGKSMADVVAQLKKLAESDTDLSGHVWLFDTLKKMGNVIQKDSMKGILGLMRKLSSRGMTCILLCHTNKYRNAEGQFQYEGTGDLEADCDELIYFEPEANADGSLTVSTRCEKRRANITDMTWSIGADRSVTRRQQYVDVAAMAAMKEQRETDQPVIEAISECLAGGPQKQLAIVERCKAYRFTDKRVRAVLKRYRGKLWLERKLQEKNAMEYSFIPQFSADPAPPAELRN